MTGDELMRSLGVDTDSLQEKVFCKMENLNLALNGEVLAYKASDKADKLYLEMITPEAYVTLWVIFHSLCVYKRKINSMYNADSDYYAKDGFTILKPFGPAMSKDYKGPWPLLGVILHRTPYRKEHRKMMTTVYTEAVHSSIQAYWMNKNDRLWTISRKMEEDKHWSTYSPVWMESPEMARRFFNRNTRHGIKERAAGVEEALRLFDLPDEVDVPWHPEVATPAGCMHKPTSQWIVLNKDVYQKAMVRAQRDAMVKGLQ